MTQTINLGPGFDAELTTDHAASSYGIPVLVYGGNAYGPGDTLILPEEDEDGLGFLNNNYSGVGGSVLAGGRVWFASRGRDLSPEQIADVDLFTATYRASSL